MPNQVPSSLSWRSKVGLDRKLALLNNFTTQSTVLDIDVYHVRSIILSMVYCLYFSLCKVVVSV